jgi:single-strand DNA-binding protein
MDIGAGSPLQQPVILPVTKKSIYMKNLSNSVTLIGHSGSEPSLNEFDTGGKLCSFSLAQNEFFTNQKGEKVERTHWFRIVAWNKTADHVAEHVRKGSMVIVLGKLVNRSYTTKEGEKRNITEVVAEEVLSVSAKGAEALAA